MPRLSVLPLMLFISSCSLAPWSSGPAIVDPTPLSGPIVWRHFSTNDDPIKTIAMEGDNLWMGTMKGIIRYNTATGEYEIYTPKNTNGGFISRGVYIIAVDPSGKNKWVGTYGGGLSRYDGKTWQRYSPEDGLGDNWVYDIEFDRQGKMWVATWNGVSVFDGSRFKTYTPADGLADKWVYSISIDRDGIFWFGTEAGVSRFEEKANRWTTFTHKDGVGAEVGVVSDGSVYSPIPSSEKAYPEGESDHSSSFAEHHVKAGRQIQSSNPNFIISSLVDRANDKWFGTWGAGIARFDGKVWTNFSDKEGLAGNYIFSLAMDRDGRIWAGTNGGTSWFDGTQWRTINDSSGLLNNNVLSVLFDRRGNRWFGTTKGLSVFKGPPPS